MCKIKSAALLILVTILSMKCAPSRFVKPLDKGEWAVGVNAGGPLIQLFDSTIPVPFTALYSGYGYSERLTLYGGLHATSLLYKTVQMDLGGTYLLREMSGTIPAFSLSANANTMVDFREVNFRLYPNIAGNLYYDLKHGRFYGGMENWIDLFPNAVPDGSQHNFWVPALFLGQTFKLKKWELTFEYKNLAPLTWNKGHVVRYARGSDRGAHGIYMSLQKRF